MFEPDSVYGHPFNRPLQNAAQKQAIVDMGTHLGPRDTLVCLSCHQMHDGKTVGNLLPDTMADGKFCLRCHPDRDTVAGTLHDLRKTAPLARNVLGQTPLEAGPCSACHEPHQPARAPIVSPGDPKGLCSSCHAPGGLAAKTAPATDHHPQFTTLTALPANLAFPLTADRENPSLVQITCFTCHDPHDSSRAHFLRDAQDALCGRCHTDQITHLIGQHDFTTHPVDRNGLGQTAAQSGKCGFCHNVHKAKGAAMWVATADSPTSAADLCVDCHRIGGLASKYPAPPFSHPTGAKFPATRPAVIPLPLFDAAGHRVEGNGLVECASCHNPHADGTQSPLLLRVTGKTSDLCLRCHAEKSTLAGSIHDSRTHRTWPGTGGKAGDDLCMACHRAHGTTSLWAVTPAAGQPTADGVCIACHGDHAWATADDQTPAKGAMMHPQKLASAATCPLPLVARLNSSARTQIGCKTCHDPHAGRDDAVLLRAPDPRRPESLCFTCHQDASGLDQSMHAAPLLTAAGLMPSGAKIPCAPCHAVHAGDDTQRDKLWANKLDLDAVTPNEQRCLGCHDGQSAPRPEIPAHPRVSFGLILWKNPAATQPAYLPTDQSIPCNVCHLPHGPTPDNAPNLPPAARGPYKIMLRPNVPQTLCATCHGPDAGRVMLYYHHAQERQDVQVLEEPPDEAVGN
ncbi:MAG TPA: cytochrome c3 family protein, partial [Tepidisphaeraceae bacterium]|nr:cytochrome c3 family protein [Tepidisphaeraceae bacterium]